MTNLTGKAMLTFMHIDSTTLILFGIALIGFILARLMDSKRFGDKVVNIVLILFSFAIGSILLPLILGIVLIIAELAYYLNGNIRDNNPYLFWGTSIIIGVFFAYWNYNKRAK